MEVLSMKSNRRKQSKPIRVSYTADTEASEIDRDVAFTSHENVDEFVNGGVSGSGSESELGKEEENADINVSSLISCSRCPETFSEERHLEDHMRDHMRVVQFGSESELPKHMIAFPTEYHRLGSELLQQNKYLTNGHAELNAVTKNPQTNGNGNGSINTGSETKDQNGDITGINKDGSRIFHPDAYCEICDREFCNKYFLKTHKANKHGVYENCGSPFTMNTIPPSMVLPPESAMSSAISSAFRLDFSSMRPQSLQLLPQPPQLSQPPPPLPLPPKPVQSLPQQTTANQKPAPPSPSQQPLQPLLMPKQTPAVPKEPLAVQPQPPSLPKKPKSLPQQPQALSLTHQQPQALTHQTGAVPSKPTAVSKPTAGSEKVVSQDMEDYCELCQKHFCNKYYLKKHKQDVHGIAPPESPVVIKRSRTQSETPPASTAIVTSSPAILPQSIASMAGLHNMPGLMVLNPFMPPLTLVPANTLLSQAQLHPHPPPPLISQAMTSQVMSQAMNSQAMSHAMTSQAITQAMNSQAMNSQAMSHAMTSQAMSQAMTSQAISQAMTSQIMSSHSDILPPSTSGTSLPNDALRSIGVLNAEAYCEMCCKEFCNKYFLKIHRANKHGIYTEEFPGPTSGTSSPLLKSGPEANSGTPAGSPTGDAPKDLSIKSEPSPKPATTATSNSMKSDDTYITYCNLCNQEFSSKYTYKIHRMQVHGMLHEGLEGIFTEELGLLSLNGDLKHMANFRLTEEAMLASGVGPDGMNSMFGSMIAAKLADRVTCDICNKELCNKYFLKAHKLKTHGIDVAAQEKEEETTVKISALEDGELEKEKNLIKQEPKEPVPATVPIPATVPTSMSWSAATVPIPATVPTSMSWSVSAMTRPNLPSAMPKPGETAKDKIPSPLLEKPSNEELVKQGIDPDAYCEICKKEFCSKYFLRTHKLNIHGIRVEQSQSPETPTKGGSTIYTPMTYTPPTHNPSMTYTPPTHNPSMAYTPPMHNPPMYNPQMYTPSMYTPPSKPMNLSSSSGSGSGKSKDGYEKHTWRWKEPVNISRVICELCNKELCNKYFLRTHKLNKHGILPTSPTTSDVDTNSNSSLPTDLTTHDRNSASPLAAKLENSPKPVKHEEKQVKNEGLNMKIKIEDEMSMNNRYYNHYTEVCHLCERRFKSTKWLKAHILKDHAGLINFPISMGPNLERPFSGLGLPADQRTCRICSSVFPSELSMQLHMIQEHNAQVTLKTDSPSDNGDSVKADSPGVTAQVQPKISGVEAKYALKRRFSFAIKQKLYSCLLCDYKTKWLNNIYSHESKIHNIIHKGSKFACKSCKKVFSSENSLVSHLQKNHQGTLEETKSNGIATRKFRCNSCGQAFISPIQCHAHVREVHIRDRSLKVSKKHASGHFSCKQCSFSSRFAKQLSHHVARFHGGRRKRKSNRDKLQNGSDIEGDFSGTDSIKHLNLQAKAVTEACQGNYIMQPFQMQDCKPNGNFITSIVEMPVHQRVDEAVTVMFKLTPMEQ